MLVATLAAYGLLSGMLLPAGSVLAAPAPTLVAANDSAAPPHNNLTLGQMQALPPLPWGGASNLTMSAYAPCIADDQSWVAVGPSSSSGVRQGYAVEQGDAAAGDYGGPSVKPACASDAVLTAPGSPLADAGASVTIPLGSSPLVTLDGQSSSLSDLVAGSGLALALAASGEITGITATSAPTGFAQQWSQTWLQIEEGGSSTQLTYTSGCTFAVGTQATVSCAAAAGLLAVNEPLTLQLDANNDITSMTTPASPLGVVTSASVVQGRDGPYDQLEIELPGGDIAEYIGTTALQVTVNNQPGHSYEPQSPLVQTSGTLEVPYTFADVLPGSDVVVALNHLGEITGINLFQGAVGSLVAGVSQNFTPTALAVDMVPEYLAPGSTVELPVNCDLTWDPPTDYQGPVAGSDQDANDETALQYEGNYVHCAAQAQALENGIWTDLGSPVSLTAPAVTADAAHATTGATAELDIPLTQIVTAVRIHYDFWEGQTAEGSAPADGPDGCLAHLQVGGTDCSVAPSAFASDAGQFNRTVAFTPPLLISLEPTALLQLNVMPYKILYQPPGDESQSSFALSQGQESSTQLTLGSSSGSAATSDTNVGVGASAQATFFGSGFSLSADHNWDDSTTSTSTSANSQSNTVDITDTFTQSWQSGVNPADLKNPAVEPWEYDEYALILHPQVAVWDVAGQVSYDLFAAQSAEYDVSAHDLLTCADGLALPIPGDYQPPIVLQPQECASLLTLDPFDLGGQSADPTLAVGGLATEIQSIARGGPGEGTLGSKTFTLTQQEATTKQTSSSTDYATSVTDAQINSAAASVTGGVQFPDGGAGVTVSGSWSQTDSNSTSMDVTYQQSQTAVQTISDSASATLGDDSNPIDTTVWLDSRWDTLMFQVPPPAVTAVSPGSGADGGGTQVTISGSNFWTGPVGVQFCPIAGGACVDGTDVRALTTGTVTATVPALPLGTVDVEVLTPGGVSPAVPGDQFVVSTPSAPQVSAVAPASGPASGGTTVTLTGRGFSSGPLNVEFCTLDHTTCLPGSGVAVSSDSALTVVSPAFGTGPVDIVVEGPGGPSTIGAADEFTFTPAALTVTSLLPAGGPAAGGTRVVLTGTGLSSASQVWFGAQDPSADAAVYGAEGAASPDQPAAGFQVVSDQELVACAPAVPAAETVYVSVYGPAGFSSVVPADQFAYSGGGSAASCTLGTGGAPPVVTAVTPGAGPAAGGQPVTINGSGFAQVSTPSTVCTSASCAQTALATLLLPPPVEFCAPSGAPCQAASDVRLVGAGTITALAPAGSGTEDVLVGGASGYSAASPADRFSFSAQACQGCGSAGAPAAAALSADRSAVLSNGLDAAQLTVTVTDAAGVPVAGAAVLLGSSLGQLSVSQAVYTDGYGRAAADLSSSSPGAASVTASVYGAPAVTLTAHTAVLFAPVPVVSGVSPSAGGLGGGTQVQITGSGLSGATAADFGASPGSGLAVDSDSALTVLAPPGSGSVAVTVANPAAISIAGPGTRFAYLPGPAVTSVVPDAGPPGTPVHVDGSGLTGASEVLFGGIPGTGLSVLGDGSLTVTAPAGTGAVDVQVVGPAGTSPASAADRFTFAAATPLAASSVEPAAGQVGVPYRGQVLAVGGTAPDQFTLASGALPAGLTLDAGSGTIAGTPQAAGTSDFAILLTDGSTPPQQATLQASILIAPAAAGVVASGSGTTSTPGGSASATAGTLAATASDGTGAVLAAQYSGDPESAAAFQAGGSYFDVHLTAGSTFSHLTVADCGLGSGNAVQWWNQRADGGLGAWAAVPAAEVQFDVPSAGCVTLTLSASTQPSLAELTGTPFAVGETSTAGGGGGGTQGSTGAPAVVPSVPMTGAAVGAAGGTLQTADGAFTLLLPAGAVPAGLTLTVGEGAAPASPPQGFTAVGPSFVLGGATLTQAEPATIRYAAADLGALSPDRLAVYALQPDGTWAFLPTAVDGTAGTVTAAVYAPETVAALAATANFSDVPSGYWAAPGIDATLAAGVVTGFPDGTFQPDGPLTRAEFTVMLARALRLAPASGPSPFTDLPQGAWYAAAVDAAAQAGLVQGVSATAFDPDAALTREQLAVLLSRALGLSATGTVTFTDAATIDAWAAAAVQAAAAAGYLQGYPGGNFEPQAGATRAQAAVVLAAVLAHLAPAPA